MTKKSFPLQQRMRDAAQEKILAAIAAGAASKREVQQTAGLSWGAVSAYINRLHDLGILDPLDTHATGTGPGRRTAGFTFNGKNFLLCGIAVAPRTFSCSLTTLGGREILGTTYEPGVQVTGKNILALTGKAVTHICQKAGITPDAVIALTLALTGAVDAPRRIWLQTPHLPALRNVRFAPLGRSFPGLRHIGVEHDVTARARAVTLRNRWPEQNYLFLHFTRGIGMAVRGEHGFITGSRGLAGEIGHIPYPGEYHNHRCSCGQTGCLELYLSEKGLLGYARRHLADQKVRNLDELGKLRGNAARKMYDHVLRLVHHTCLVGANLFDPHAIYLGGETVAPWQELLVRDLPRRLHASTWQSSPSVIRFYQETDGDPAYGAVLGIRDTMISLIAGQTGNGSRK